MPKCVKIRRKKRQVCIGDLDTEITIRTRDLDDSIDSTDEVLSFTTVLTAWAMVETLKDVFIVDEVTGGDQPVSHRIVIRVPDITIDAANWVNFGSENYRILGQTDYDERGEFLELMCTVRGDDDREAADA